jgi:predicted ArsR family transcriptional regulator
MREELRRTARNESYDEQVAEAVALSPRSARTRLKALVEKGLIVEVGSSPTDPKRECLPFETTGCPAEAK